MTQRLISMWALALMSVVGLVMNCTVGQNTEPDKMKKMWSPPDKSFTVDVPVKLDEIKGEYDDISHEGYKSIKLFGSSESNGSYGTFEVVILELSEKEKRPVQGKLEGLEFLIGGDDQKPTKDAFVKVDGLPARELVFSSPDKCSKGLIIDGGERIYVLGLVVNVCKDLESTVANRFFESFHLTHRK